MESNAPEGGIAWNSSSRGPTREIDNSKVIALDAEGTTSTQSSKFVTPSGTLVSSYLFHKSDGARIGLSMVDGPQMPFYEPEMDEILFVVGGSSTFVDRHGCEEHVMAGNFLLIRARHLFTGKDLKGYKHLYVVFPPGQAPAFGDITAFKRLSPSTLGDEDFAADGSVLRHQADIAGVGVGVDTRESRDSKRANPGFCG